MYSLMQGLIKSVHIKLWITASFKEDFCLTLHFISSLLSVSALDTGWLLLQQIALVLLKIICNASTSLTPTCSTAAEWQHLCWNLWLNTWGICGLPSHCHSNVEFKADIGNKKWLGLLPTVQCLGSISHRENKLPPML